MLFLSDWTTVLCVVSIRLGYCHLCCFYLIGLLSFVLLLSVIVSQLFDVLATCTLYLKERIV